MIRIQKSTLLRVLFDFASIKLEKPSIIELNLFYLVTKFIKHESPPFWGLLVVSPGIEPGTHGFSVRCSTN